MTAKEVRKRIKEILALYQGGESETAHDLEDGLLWEFVNIESGAGNEIARIMISRLYSKKVLMKRRKK